MGQTFGGTRPVLSSQWGNQKAGGGKTKDDSRENAGTAGEEDPLRINKKIKFPETERMSQSSVSLSGHGQSCCRVEPSAGWAVGEYLQQEEESGADEKRQDRDQGANEGQAWGTSSRPLTEQHKLSSSAFPFWNKLLSWQLLNKQMKETRAQVVTLNFQKKLYKVGEAPWLFISVILGDEVDEDRSHLLLLFQEAQERQEQWEEDAKQMLQEKERELNNIGCRKTLNFDKLSELSRTVSLDAIADDAKRKRWC